MLRANTLSTLVGLCALAAPTLAMAADNLGIVSSVRGVATAQRPGESPRQLSCGDAIYSDDTLRTDSGSRVGVLLEDVVAHLAQETQVKLGRTDQAQPHARLEIGKVRMIDPREGGNPAQLAALDATADVVGNDAEAYIFSEKIGPYAMLCEWDDTLPVNRDPSQGLSAAPGECVISKPKEPLYTARAHDARIAAGAPEDCDLGPAIATIAGAPGNHLTPGDVAAPPLAGIDTTGLGDRNPLGGVLNDRRACDTPAGSCAQPLPFQVFEPPPVSGPAPGVGGALPIP